MFKLDGLNKYWSKGTQKEKKTKNQINKRRRSEQKITENESANQKKKKIKTKPKVNLLIIFPCLQVQRKQQFIYLMTQQLTIIKTLCHCHHSYKNNIKQKSKMMMSG